MPKEKLAAFPYYGGKFSHLDWTLSHLPRSDAFASPFCGSAAVEINKEPSEIEAINDIDGLVVNFFRVLREHPRELVDQLLLTPTSKAEWDLSNIDSEKLTPIERARRFYVSITQSVNNTPGSGWSFQKLPAGLQLGKNIGREFRRAPKLLRIALRIRRMHLDCSDFRTFIQRWDTPKTLFYCDPPYVMATRSKGDGYRNELSGYDHVTLAKLLRNIKGKAAVAGYRGELYDMLYRDWNRHDAPHKLLASSGRTQGKTKLASKAESLWTNY